MTRLEHNVVARYINAAGNAPDTVERPQKHSERSKMVPIIHMNGSDKETLEREYEAAARAVQAAIKAVEDITVHGRDYYPLGDDAFRQARDEHIEHLQALEKVKKDLTYVWLAIHKSGNQSLVR